MEEPAITSIPSPKPSNNKIFKISLIVIGILIIIGLFLNAYLLLKKEKAANIATPTPQMTKPSPTPDPTASWETYTNSTAGIELKYPKSWTTKKFSIGTVYPIYPVVELVSDIKPDPNKWDWPSIQIYYFENPENLTLPQLEEKYTSSESGLGPKIYQGKGEWTKVDEIDAYRIKDGDCEPFMCDKVSIPYKQRVYVIQNFLVIPETTFDQILSTFRFD